MLERGIQRSDAVFLIINAVIGAGIFALPARVFALSGAYSLLAFIACAAVMLIIVLVFAEVSSRFDQTGGPYLYVHHAFGPMPAFFIGWLLLLTRLFTYATLVNLLAVYLSFFTETLLQPGIRVLFILLITALLTAINIAGVRGSSKTSTFLGIGKLVPLAIFIIVGLFFVDTSNLDFSAVPSADQFSAATLLLIFAFGGFESGLVNSGEIANPRKNLPFALITAAAVITLFYVLIQFVSIGTLPGLATSEKPIADAAIGFMGWPGGLLITAGAAISIFGTLHIQILSGSRLPFALSQAGQFPGIFSRIHPSTHTPVISILLFAVLAAIISLVWGFMSSLAISVIVRLVMYALVCASLIRLRHVQPGGDHFRAPWGKALAVAGILATIWLLSGTQWNEIRDALLWTLLGVGIFVVERFRKG